MYEMDFFCNKWLQHNQHMFFKNLPQKNISPIEKWISNFVFNKIYNVKAFILLKSFFE